ncbi:MAG: restriction endonuclease [Ignisphaera sp.]|nr:restriction endonuclease [Ignisphaera sp.]
MGMYILLYDILEHLFKFGSIEKGLLDHVRIGDRPSIESIIENGIERNMLKEDDSKIYLLNPFEFLLLLDEIGLDTSRLCSYISWSEFENFVANKLYEFGWEYILGYSHKRISRFQIDVIAMDFVLKRALVIECKHWRKSLGVSSLKRIVLDHLVRVDKLVNYCEWVTVDISRLRDIENLIPVVVTLKKGGVKVIEGVPIVSLHHLGDFLINISSYLELLNIKVFKNRCYVQPTTTY